MDESRCELICLYIKAYKCFKNVLINLSSRYSSELCGAYDTSGVVNINICYIAKKRNRYFMALFVVPPDLFQRNGQDVF